jgi:hypothetical protein
VYVGEREKERGEERCGEKGERKRDGEEREVMRPFQ